MNEEMVKQMMAAAERLAVATETLDRVLGKLDAQQEMLNAKVERIVAAVEENLAQAAADRSRVSHNQGDAGRSEHPPFENREGWGTQLQARVAELEKSNADLKAQAARLARKTISPVVAALIGKNEIEGERMDPAVLNKTLASLSVEQRVAVKSELARAGVIE